MEHTWSMYALSSFDEGIVPLRDGSGRKINSSEVARVARKDRKSRRKYRKIWRKASKNIDGFSPEPHLKAALVDQHIMKKTMKKM